MPKKGNLIVKKLVALASAGLLTLAVAAPAFAAPEKDQCPPGWDFYTAVSDAAKAIDERGNGDGTVCGKEVPGKGNGDFLLENYVVKDNNQPDKD